TSSAASSTAGWRRTDGSCASRSSSPTVPARWHASPASSPCSRPTSSRARTSGASATLPLARPPSSSPSRREASNMSRKSSTDCRKKATASDRSAFRARENSAGFPWGARHLGLTTAFLLMLLTLGCQSSSSDGEPASGKESTAERTAAPRDRGPQTPTALSNEALAELITNREGRPLVVHFWASWCAPCIEEWPTLQALADTWQDRGVDFVMVSVDDSIDHKAMLDFLEQRPASGDNRWWSSEDMDALLRITGGGWQGGLPATFVYDTDGELQRAWLEQVDRSRLESLLGTLTALASPPRTLDTRLAQRSP